MNKTRPLLCCNRYLYNPGEKHLTQAKIILRYLKGTQEYGINLTRDFTRLGQWDLEIRSLKLYLHVTQSLYRL